MAKTVDARGLSCPQPVMMTLDAIKAGNSGEIIVLVDSETAKENVCRAAIKGGGAVAAISDESGEFSITIRID
jgi:tRNA 2-thiouridine synthesizing protein A